MPGAVARRVSVLAALGCLTLLQLVVQPGPPALAGPASQPARQAGPPASNEDAIIVIDVSESVRGIGRGTNNIWAQVQRSVSDLLDLLPEGTNVAIVPFSRGPEQHQAFPQGTTDPKATLRQAAMTSADERERAKAYVNDLLATGQFTHVVPTLEYALYQLEAWRAQRGPTTGLQAVYIYTDGIDNEPGRTDWMADASRLLGTRGGDSPFLWVAYVQVAANNPQPCQRPIHCAPGVNNAAPPSIRVVDTRLDFEPLSSSRDQSTRRLQLEVRRPTDSKVPLDLEMTLEPPAPGLTLEPRHVDDAQSFELVVSARPDTAPGNYKGTVTLRSSSALFVGPNRVPVVLSFQGPPTATPLPPPPSPTATVPPPSPTATVPPTAPPTSTVAPSATTVPPTPVPSPTPPLREPGPPPPVWPLWILSGAIVVILLGIGDNFWRRFE